MGIILGKPYVYGADFDGNRGSVKRDIDITSDLSGKPIDEDSVYRYDDMIVSYLELRELLGVEEVSSKDDLNCDQEYGCQCSLKDIATYYVKALDCYLCEDCLENMIDGYHISSYRLANYAK